MDPYSYKNWDDKDDSVDESPPAYGGSSYGFSGHQGRSARSGVGTSDDYDFSIEKSDDEADTKDKADTKQRPKASRRKSTGKNVFKLYHYL